MIAWVFVGAYVIFALWWQYEYVLPLILTGHYIDAFNVIMGVNPAFPLYLILFSLLFLGVGKVFGWFHYAWIKLFGD